MQRASLTTAAQQSALRRALEPQICPDTTMRNGCARLSNDSTQRSDFWLPVSVIPLMKVQPGNLRCLPHDYKVERHNVVAKQGNPLHVLRTGRVTSALVRFRSRKHTPLESSLRL